MWKCGLGRAIDDPTMAGAFTQSVVIRAAPAELFALTQDYARRLEWDPFLKRAELLNAAEPGPGVEAVCVARATGLAMTTQYVSFDPPTVCAVRMTRGPWFVKQFAGSWRFAAVSPEETEVSFRYLVVARPRWLTPVIRWVFARDTRKRLAALKEAAARRAPTAQRVPGVPEEPRP